MLTVQQLLAEAVEASKGGVTRFLPGFDDGNRTRQAANLPNHASWSLGHLAMTMHRAAAMLDNKPLPESDFIAGASVGDATRFGTESVAFNSEPKDTPDAFPTMARSRAVFESACDRLAAALRGASNEALEAKVKWGAMELPLYLLVTRMLGHNGIHAGQLTDLRRALGFSRVIV